MKAQRRHELKENVLAHELTKLREIFAKYGNWIVGALAAAAIVLLVARYYVGRGEAQYMSEKARFERLVGGELKDDERLEGLEDMAHNATDEVLGASSAIWAGSFCADRFLKALQVSPAEAARHRKKAEEFYRIVLSKYPGRKLFAAKAQLGLGVMAENAGDRTAAMERYRQVAPLVHGRHPVAVEAMRRLNRLRQSRTRPARFATTRATQPATAPSGAAAK